MCKCLIYNQSFRNNTIDRIAIKRNSTLKGSFINQNRIVDYTSIVSKVFTVTQKKRLSKIKPRYFSIKIILALVLV